MTHRDFLEKIMAGEMTEEIQAHAVGELEKMAAAAEVRRAKTAEKSAAREAEKAPMREAVYACLSPAPEFKTATTLIAEAGLEMKPQSIPHLLKPAVEAGVVVKGSVKVAGKGRQVGYALAE